MTINPYKKPNNSVSKYWHRSWRAPLYTIKGFFRMLKWGWQRTVNGYCDVDLWNMDDWMCDLLPVMLLDLKEHGCGYPGIEGAQTPEEWASILEEMAMAFWAAGEDNRYSNCMQDFIGVVKEEEVGNFFRQDYNNIYEAREQEKKKAFSLMEKWFHYLWD